jgi:plastocyanin
MIGRRTFVPPATRWLVSGPCAEAALVVAASVLLVGCSSEPTAPPPTEAQAGVGEVTTDADGVQEITLQTQDDYVFTPDSFTVRPGQVRLTVVNVGEQMVHNFRFTPDTGPVPIEAQIDILPAGEEETVEFEVAEPGEYPFECSFHIQLDQVGTMTVSEP